MIQLRTAGAGSRVTLRNRHVGCERNARPERPTIRIMLWATIALTGLSFSQVATGAWMGNAYVSRQSPISPDPMPVDSDDDSAGWDWPDGKWEFDATANFNVNVDQTIITATIPGPIVIDPGEFRLFGLDNSFEEDNKKTYTVGFNYVGGDPSFSGGDSGVHPEYGYDGGVTRTKTSETDVGGRFEVVYEITPQPSWEYVAVRNAGSAPINILGNVSFRSVCEPNTVPEPATLMPLGLAGLAFGFRRIRRQVTV